MQSLILRNCFILWIISLKANRRCDWIFLTKSPRSLDLFFLFQVSTVMSLPYNTSALPSYGIFLPSLRTSASKILPSFLPVYMLSVSKPKSHTLGICSSHPCQTAISVSVTYHHANGHPKTQWIKKDHSWLFLRMLWLGSGIHWQILLGFCDG